MQRKHTHSRGREFCSEKMEAETYEGRKRSSSLFFLQPRGIAEEADKLACLVSFFFLFHFRSTVMLGIARTEATTKDAL